MERDTFLDEQEVLYRVGLRLLDPGTEAAVVEVVLQSGYRQDSDPDSFSTQREQHTVEHVGGGPAWYVTDFLVTEYAGQGGATTVDAADRAWADCCDLVVSELDRRAGDE